MFIKLILIFMLLQGFFPTYTIAKDSVEQSNTIIETEINYVKELMTANIGQFLKAKERFQLCTISLWIANTMESDQDFISFINDIGIVKFKAICSKILDEIKAETRGVNGIENLPAISFFIMSSNNLNITLWAKNE